MVEWRLTGEIRPGADGAFIVDLTVSGDEPARPRSRTSTTKVVALSDDEIARRIEEALPRLGDELAELAGQMVDLMAAENKSKRVSLSRVWREVWLPVDAAVEKLGRDAMVYGMTTALAKGVSNVNYAKKAADSFSASPAAASIEDRYDMIGGFE